MRMREKQKTLLPFASLTLEICYQAISMLRVKTSKARFRRRSFHEPNLFRIKADQNDLVRLS